MYPGEIEQPGQILVQVYFVLLLNEEQTLHGANKCGTV